MDGERKAVIEIGWGFESNTMSVSETAKYLPEDISRNVTLAYGGPGLERQMCSSNRCL